MLQKIHYAKPTVQNKVLRKHEERTNQLKKMVSDGSRRQAVMQAARQLILSKDLNR